MQKPLPSAAETLKLPSDGGPDYNRLVHEKSPYLLQHATNPVDWYPWGDEAFDRARELNKPIFLSVGYATCHWCHVMEKESFEDERVAGLLNEYFICIKVDREERPDIDNVYMTVTQALTGQGGWPMTVFMTPERKPFFAGTFFPKNSRQERPGMVELVPHIGKIWREQRQRLLEDADRLTRQIGEFVTTPKGGSVEKKLLDETFFYMADTFDAEFGGFGSAPKFPAPHVLTFLLRYWRRTGEPKALQMVEKTLQQMHMGGLFDHIGFGFHRYSTDRVWLLPHFEKMLYDQALLTIAYVETFQATGKKEYAQITRQVLTYVLRDMTSPKGGFYSAEDADSEGEEGLFYLWEPDELLRILGPGDGDFFIRLYNIEKGGNFHEQATGSKTGKSIPHLQAPMDRLATLNGLKVDQLERIQERIRTKLYRVRKKRVFPLKDDKILTDWNGLMIAALAKAGAILGEKEYIDAAIRAAGFILSELRQKNGRLVKRYRNGTAGLPAHLDDYAFLTWGLLELYEACFDVDYLRKAVELTELVLDLFWDQNSAGFFLTANDGEKLLFRSKQAYDGALPSGNSVAAMNLLRLSHMLAKPAYEKKAELLLMEFSGMMKKGPGGFCQMLNAVDFFSGPSVELVIAGIPCRPDAERMLSAVRKVFLPGKVVVFRPTDHKDPEICQLAAYTQQQRAVNNQATAYLCENFSCRQPVTNPRVLEKELEK